VRASRLPVRGTIWHVDAIPVIEGQTSLEMKRIVLPLFDILMIIMGYNALLQGMPSFELALPEWMSPWLSSVAGWMLTLGGVSALVGISIPRLWIAEALGKLLMVMVIGGYAAALWALYLLGDPNRGFVAAGMSALVVIPMWNLARLGRERLQRRIITAMHDGGDQT
jgi:hypothetical protein